MKVTIGKRDDGYSVYVAKKDLQEPIIDMEKAGLWGGWVELGNGWRLALPEMTAEVRLPITIEAVASRASNTCWAVAGRNAKMAAPRRPNCLPHD